MKLLSVDRALVIFHNKTDALVNEYPIATDVSILKKIVKQRKNDDFLYLPYILNKLQAKKLIKELGIALLVELKTYTYVMDCYGNYDFNSQ